MKIKTKKQLNLPQLIEWAWDNKINNHIIRADKQLMNIQFDVNGDFRTYGFDGTGTTFTVEVEEEITEDTVIDNLYKMDEFYEFYSTEYKTIKDVIRHSVFKVKAIYLNDDLTMTLIWRDGKLVE